MFQSTLAVILIRLIGVGLQTIILVLLARSLSIPDMGTFALLYSGIVLIRALGPIGADQVTMRAISGHLGQNDARAASQVAFDGLVLVLTISVLGGVALALLSFFADTGGTGFSPAESIAIAVTVPATAVAGILTYQLRGFGRIIFAQIPESLLQNLVFAGALLFFSASGLTLAETVIAFAISAVFSLLIYLTAFWRTVGRASARPKRASLASLARKGVVVLQAFAVTAISQRIPILLSAPLLGVAATAYLEIAARFGMLAIVTTTAVGVNFSPSLARAFAQGDLHKVNALVRQGSLMAAVPAVGALLVLAILFPTIILDFLPAEYRQSFFPMLAFALAACINAVFSLNSNALIMADRADLVRNYSLAQMLVLLMSCVALGSAFGTIGVAAGVVLGTITRDVGLFFARKRLIYKMTH